MTGEASQGVSAERTRSPQRRCVFEGRRQDRSGLIRFAVSPDGEVVPDVAERLPGRGLWVRADRRSLEAVRRRNLFSRAARMAVRVPDDLADRIEATLARRCCDLLGLARRAGEATFGYERVRDWLARRPAALLLEASDGALGDSAKLRGLAHDLPVAPMLRADELGAAFGRSRVVHAVVAPGGLARELVRETGRLMGFRAQRNEPFRDGDGGRPSQPRE